MKKITSKKETPGKINGKYYAVIIIVALSAAIILSQTMSPSEKDPSSQAATKKLESEQGNQYAKEQILEKLAAFPELEPYASYDTKITEIANADLKALSQKQPVIYANISGDSLYKIEYTKATDGYLVIYDAAKNKILRQFRITSMQLNR